MNIAGIFLTAEHRYEAEADTFPTTAAPAAGTGREKGVGVATTVGDIVKMNIGDYGTETLIVPSE